VKATMIPLALLAALTATAGTGSGPSPPLRLAVIVHPEVEVTDLSLEELKSIISMERQFWPSKRRPVILLRPSQSTEMKVILDVVLKKPYEDVRREWVRKLYAGEIPSLPSIVRTPSAVVQAVKRTPGAISFVSTAEPLQGVRLLSIDGIRPDHPAYALVERP
jgi:hypothetical protein